MRQCIFLLHELFLDQLLSLEHIVTLKEMIIQIQNYRHIEFMVSTFPIRTNIWKMKCKFHIYQMNNRVV
jgi:hypothetical protein